MDSGDGGSGAAASTGKEVLDTIKQLQELIVGYNTELPDLQGEMVQLANQLNNAAADEHVKEKLEKAVKDVKTCRAKREKALHLSQLLRKSLLELSANPAKTEQFVKKTLAGEELDSSDVGSWLPMSDCNHARLGELFTLAEASLDEILSMIPEEDDEEEEEINEERRKKQKMDQKNEEDEDINDDDDLN